jgi:hypothetical protein
VASIQRTGRPARKRKKYVPSAKQRAEDQRIKENLDHLTSADIKRFDQLLGRAIAPEK